MEKKDKDCHINCYGLYADTDYNPAKLNNYTKDHLVLERLRKAYDEYKSSYVKNMFLEDVGDNYTTKYKMKTKPYHPLQVVQIYFDTATYDEIVKDVSVTLTDQLGVIGGTMGLFAGFSFLSAAEVIYFLGKYLLKLVKKKS